MNEKRSSRNFTLKFVLALLAVSAAVFVIFTVSQRWMAQSRREISRSHLEAVRTALKDFVAAHAGAYPGAASELVAAVANADENLTHPAWPEQAGYVFVSGVRADDAPGTIAIYENVPERKRAQGVMALYADGRIELFTGAEFARRLAAQEERWTQTGRVWHVQEMGGRRHP
jgi:hypothetical protein